MARHIVPVIDDIESELSCLVGTPLYDNGDAVELILTADQWAALLARRARVGWPLHFSVEAMGHE